MKSGLNIRQKVGYVLERAGRIVAGNGFQSIESQLAFNNPFGAMHYRLKDPDALQHPKALFHDAYKLLNIVSGKNDVTIVGKNHLLDVTFGAAAPLTQIDPWHIGLVDQSPTPTFAEADTSASHAGWSEFTDYTGNRKVWDDADAATKVKGTTTTSDFTINASGEVNGIFIDSLATTTAGILWATGSFDASVVVVNTDVLKITYGIRT